MQRDQDLPEEKGTGFTVEGAAGYAFPYCQPPGNEPHTLVPGEKLSLYPVRIFLRKGDIVEVRFSAFARGGLVCFLEGTPAGNVRELMASKRALNTDWAEVQGGAIDPGPWYSLHTATCFEVFKDGEYTFCPVLERHVTGKFAVHHQNIQVRVIGKGPAVLIEGEWPS